MLETYGRWMEYVAEFSMIVHPKYGYFIHFPFSGGLYDQPWREMEIFKIMLQEYRKVLKEKNPDI